jgi:hypothetical protein
MAEQNAQLFAGDLYVSFETAPGVFGAATLIRTDMMSITTPSDKVEVVSRNRDDYGQAFASYHIAKPSQFEIQFTEVTRDLLAVQLSGMIETITAPGGVFVDLPVTADVGAWVDIGRKNLAVAGLVVKNAAGTTTYDKDVDYRINYRLGKLLAIENGAITDAATLKVSGTAQATTGTRIKGARKHQHVMRLELDGMNLISGKDTELLAYRAVVSSDQAYDFLQAKMAVVKLKGTLEVPSVGVPAFIVEERVVS